MIQIEQLKRGEITETHNLKLSCALNTFPNEILHLHDTLEMLDLSNNCLSYLPNDFSRLQKLKIAFFSNNCFTELPVVLSQCVSLEMIAFRSNQIATIPDEALSANLRWLILTNNRISSIPSSIGKCSRLQKLMLAGNSLEQLPDSISQCQNLELIRISANKFKEIPTCLFSLPKLSWLGFAGNPCCVPLASMSNLQLILWEEVRILENIGEGASGTIMKIEWKAKSELPLALKLFKGDITSDGSPLDEMSMHLLSGKHNNLVQVLGKIVNHPEAKQGLVLELIPSQFKNLGNPPNFDTCTRDTYSVGTTFSLEQIHEIASQLASVMLYLHERGIMHGDLYAHNILVHHTHILLSDLGAATYYNRAHPSNGAYFERLDVRAFGYLLDDLLQRVNTHTNDSMIMSDLIELKDHCLKTAILENVLTLEQSANK